MPTAKIPMMFYKNTRPYDNYVEPEPTDSILYNTRAPIAKYYRKTTNCCDNDVIEVLKNNKCCYDSKIRSANTASVLDPNTGKKIDYKHSTSEYLYSRCKSFKQKGFHFNLNQQTKEGYANCGSQCKTIYKPSNAKFQTQGAVSSGERMVRLKYNTVRTSQKYNANHISYRGDTTQNVFISKSPLCNKC